MKKLLLSTFKSQWFPRPLANLIATFYPYSTPWFYGKNIVTRYKKYDSDLLVDVCSDDLSRKMARQVYEKDTLFAIESCVRKGDICLDIGANVGAISLILSKRVAAKGLVVAIEPGNNNFKNLLANMDLNRNYTKNISALKFAVSNKGGTSYWVEDSKNLGNAFVYESIDAFDPVEENFHVVSCVVLDELLIDLLSFDKLDFVKIDVEGMEYEVLKGMTKCIEKFKPAIYFETIDALKKEQEKGQQVYKEIEAMLMNFGYKLFSMDHSRLAETRYPNFSKNTLAIPQERLSQVSGNIQSL